jgi:hypothetical protein
MLRYCRIAVAAAVVIVVVAIDTDARFFLSL